MVQTVSECYYKKGYKYQLHLPYRMNIPISPVHDIETKFINLDKYGNLLIKSGYAWDGPSGPSIDTKSFMRGSLVHDALYQLIANCHLERKDRFTADKILKQICLEDGMFSFRAWYVYKAVRKYGSRHLKIPKVYCAP